MSGVVSHEDSCQDDQQEGHEAPGGEEGPGYSHCQEARHQSCEDQGLQQHRVEPNLEGVGLPDQAEVPGHAKVWQLDLDEYPASMRHVWKTMVGKRP